MMQAGKWRGRGRERVHKGVTKVIKWVSKSIENTSTRRGVK